MSSPSQPVEHPSWDDIDLYLAGSADAATSRRISEYFDKHTEMEGLIRKHLQPSFSQSSSDVMWSTENTLASLHERMEDGAKFPHRWISSRFVRLGVSGAVLAVIGTGLWMQIDEINTEHIEASSFAMTYQTHNAQQSTIVLNDGTRVVLNVKSALYIPEGFGQEIRTVKLEGEAYFEVTHHGKAPFIVETEQTHNRVLGTEFAIRAYPGEEERVSVRSGRIAVNSTVVGKQEVAMIDRAGLVRVVKDDVEKMIGFSEGKMILRNIPLKQALVDLERWYDVRIVLANSALGETRINATLFTGTIEDLEEMLRLTFDVRVERESRLVTVYAE